MSAPGSWCAARPLETSALVLEPLRVEHAAGMAAVLDDERLHAFTGGQPATPKQLRARYESQVVGTAHQGHGFAREAAEVVLARLFQRGAVRVVADIHPAHGRRTRWPRASACDARTRWSTASCAGPS